MGGDGGGNDVLCTYPPPTAGHKRTPLGPPSFPPFNLGGFHVVLSVGHSGRKLQGWTDFSISGFVKFRFFLGSGPKPAFL